MKPRGRSHKVHGRKYIEVAQKKDHRVGQFVCLQCGAYAPYIEIVRHNPRCTPIYESNIVSVSPSYHQGAWPEIMHQDMVIARTYWHRGSPEQQATMSVLLADIVACALNEFFESGKADRIIDKPVPQRQFVAVFLDDRLTVKLYWWHGSNDLRKNMVNAMADVVADALEFAFEHISWKIHMDEKQADIKMRRLTDVRDT